jgi:signal recognition particle subunit SRP54
MFERLSDGFSKALKNLSGQGRISESNIRDALQEVRTALLEADVDYDLVKDFCERVRKDAVGHEVTKSVKPAQEFIWIVQQRLTELMQAPEGTTPGVMRVSPSPTVIMMCGLQGSGKTTTCGKLAAYLKKRGRSVMLVAADLQRPAAVDQLETVANQVRDEAPGGAQVHFYGEADKCAEYGKAVGVAVDVCARAIKQAKKDGVDTVILDTAGRLHVDDDLMGELQRVRAQVQPHQIFLVVDSMIGQDAVTSAKAFHERLEVDGVILTKFDSDTRGGAALSVRRVTGAPVRFIGTGEKIDAIEEFHADRIASRILGMGDVVSLVEKAQEEVTEEEAEALQAKMARGELTMDDFLKQLKSLRRMGPMKQLLGMLPGVGGMLKDANVDEGQIDRVEAMINSMTREERADVDLMSNSRRKRIATGSGTKTEDVSRLTKQFGAVSKMARQMAGMSMMDKAKAARQLAGAQQGGGLRMKGSTRTQSPKDKYKKRKRR